VPLILQVAAAVLLYASPRSTICLRANYSQLGHEFSHIIGVAFHTANTVPVDKQQESKKFEILQMLQYKAIKYVTSHLSQLSLQSIQGR